MSSGDNKLFSSLENIMKDTVDTYLNSEEEPLNMTSDDEDPAIIEVQEKYNQLQERCISLKTMTETLKERISTEKEQLSKELKATVQMQAQLAKTKHECGDRSDMCRNQEEHNRKALKDFLYYQHATDSFDQMIKKRQYQSLLSEIDTKCSLELLKIKESMTMLKPLQDMASKWQTEQTRREAESGNGKTDKNEGCSGEGDMRTDNIETSVKEPNEQKKDDDGSV